MLSLVLVALALEPTQANIAYSGHPQTVLDIYQPAGAAGGKRPGVVAIHGGGWVSGSKERSMPTLVEPWLAKGFVVANVEYRLAKVATAPAAVVDALAAVEWFRKNASKYGVDPKRIIVTGESAGGHLALMSAMVQKSSGFGSADRVAAVINFWGITDVEDQVDGSSIRQYATTWVPDSTSERREFARKLSPVSYVRKDLPPILTIHGDADETVPYDHGVELTRLLRNAKSDAELIPLRGYPHGFQLPRLAEIYGHVWAFLGKRGLMP